MVLTNEEKKIIIQKIFISGQIFTNLPGSANK